MSSPSTASISASSESLEDVLSTIQTTSTSTSTVTTYVQLQGVPPARVVTTITRALPDLAKAGFADEWMTATGARLLELNAGKAQTTSNLDTPIASTNVPSSDGAATTDTCCQDVVSTMYTTVPFSSITPSSNPTMLAASSERTLVSPNGFTLTITSTIPSSPLPTQPRPCRKQLMS